MVLAAVPRWCRVVAVPRNANERTAKRGIYWYSSPEQSSQSYEVSLVIMGSHRDITCYPTQVNTPAVPPARQAGTRFTYPGGMEG